jgi:hypothetical protein
MDFRNILDRNNDILDYYGNSITVNKINIKGGYISINSNLNQSINEGQSQFAIIWNDPKPLTNDTIIISPDSTQFRPIISGIYSVNCNFILDVSEPDFFINNVEIFFRIQHYDVNNALISSSLDTISSFKSGNTTTAVGSRVSSSLCQFFNMKDDDYIQVIAGIASAGGSQNFTIQILQASLQMNFLNGDVPLP